MPQCRTLIRRLNPFSNTVLAPESRLIAALSVPDNGYKLLGVRILLVSVHITARTAQHCTALRYRSMFSFPIIRYSVLPEEDGEDDAEV